jgi:hypothetical protein
LAAASQGIGNITNPEMAETIAFRCTILFAMQQSYDRVMVASDCLSLINNLKSHTMDHPHRGIIMEDIKFLMRTSSVIFSFINVIRLCNQVAHVLARSADQLVESVWFDSALFLLCQNFVTMSVSE